MQDESVRGRSIRTLPFCWVQKALFSLNPSWRAILAYTALAYEFTGERTKDVPLKRMAALVGVSEDTIMRGLKELAEKKAIKIKPHYRIKNGKRQQLPNEYILVDLDGHEQTPI